MGIVPQTSSLRLLLAAGLGLAEVKAERRAQL